MSEQYEIKDLFETVREGALALMDDIVPCVDELIEGEMADICESVRDTAGEMMKDTAAGANAVSMASIIEGRSNGDGERGMTGITQNIYLRENDPSPYQTARAIRRES